MSSGTSENANGVTLVPRDGHAYRFDPGALFLDFLLSGGPGPIARWESLNTPEDLRSWFSRTRLRLEPADIRAGPADVEDARRMRDALWRLVHERLGRGRAEPGDLEAVNEAASRPSLVPRMESTGVPGDPEETADAAAGHAARAAWATPIEAAQVTSHIARSAIDLLTGPWSGRIRECGADNCMLVFVDLSRPGKRRWCSMERCGNRTKVRALRARKSADAP
ncbi:CGNR zinc finger domain-containing protein [Nocardiopsis suaedae]|uniref:CGNR zinc finger domain-containing protein n=1 Tax=Nocardiopsis suaedae TaxID=3018444 RepID=A0ABT4TLT6_9ACTN|nr:ABATE domain-containing protein [Nocardiopsis suaedae]MDA2805657.1 CGNR zinc finger domain-containing protein [Nocardiopsis suaedae]